MIEVFAGRFLHIAKINPYCFLIPRLRRGYERSFGKILSKVLPLRDKRFSALPGHC
jgi:hypothetical protein